ncbi:3-methyladenine DNA glycosylase/8-oxoguanine DNA glycosylase [Chthonomonas calidirosea]|uniref:DNA glycosylase n=1 Tax=Chthonomonas calidirosea TaxID=454171 RepID=UPI0006DD54B6|nr:DNA glycosylase [Chthonomonas calidirosea]CEK17836.1 3-methyladenine DNA glycosylase/8-oxoguanine DNA glycosylase [Chthonomonas calidirosea]
MRQVTTHNSRIAWRRFDCSKSPLHLEATLRTGQSFRWCRDANGVWWGTIESVGVALWQPDGEPYGDLYWQTFPEPDLWEVVEDYLQLRTDLESLYCRWSFAEPRLAEVFRAFAGLRVLRQPPEECLFAFLCATTNTVTKIERSVRYLAERYGARICTGLDKPATLFAFPSVSALSAVDERDLRAGLWGYRAPFVIKTAQKLLQKPQGWLRALRDVPYAEAHEALLEFPGVGPKVADCVCLFALDKWEAVPVDRHIYRLGVRLFLPHFEGRSLTPRLYRAVAEAFRERFGPMAGWAQQTLFYAEAGLYSRPDKESSRQRRF